MSLRTVMVVLALCAPAILAGCRSPNAEGYLCSATGQCPGGYTCGNDGRCHKGPVPDGGWGSSDARDAVDTGPDVSGEAGGTCSPDQPCEPANKCHLGRTKCSAGDVVTCEDTAQPQSAGVPCGTSMVCSGDGSCVACAAGSSCERSGQPCKVGKVSCATGSAVCMEAGNVPEGTMCGTNMVCSTGACVPCTNGAACAPANPCHTGTLSCGGGAPTCTDSGTSVSDGQTCATDKVCYQGACVDCRAGTSCQVSGKPCRSGVTSCNTGQAVCQETGNAENGTTCDTGKVCSNGSCLACEAGATCVPTNPCHKGTLTCGSGTPTCVDSATAVQNGTGCGIDKVCSNGSCVDCAANRDCVPTGTTCKAGITSCSTGVLVCQQNGNAQNGAQCGANMVCSDGSCITCAAGTACTPPAAPCHNGTLSCSAGTPTCTDAGTNRSNGTSCGTNLVCNAGSCVPCTADQACNPGGNLCQLGQTSCTTGTSTCVLTGNVPSGTSCGTNKVCNGGTCQTCTAGTSCTPPNAVCHVGSQTCDTGAPICTDSGQSARDGSSCGTNFVCSGGSCVSCVAGTTCSPANVCHTGQTTCATGIQTCSDTGSAAPNGTPCGSNLGCAFGACTCTQGTSCLPSDPCQTGTTSCSSGTSACVANGTKPDGSTCGPGKSCSKGVCDVNPGCPKDGSAAFDCPCSAAGVMRCNGAHQKLRLICSGGIWTTNGTCLSAENCDQADGTCKPIVTQCQNQTASYAFCQDDVLRTCGVDWVSTSDYTCPGTCSSGACQTPFCGDGKVETNEECDDGNSNALDGCEPRNPPVAEAACHRTKILSVSAGAVHTCGLFSGGYVRCWGANNVNQLGLGHTQFQGDRKPHQLVVYDASGNPVPAGPVNLGGLAATAVSAGYDFSCALLSDASVRCWGANDSNQLGLGNVNPQTATPAALGAVAVGGQVKQVAAGIGFACALLTTGNVRCWGVNVGGRLGTGDTADLTTKTPAQIAALYTGWISLGAQATSIGVGANAACALLSDGNIRCWGSNSSGTLGIGTNTQPSRTTVPSGYSAVLLPSGRTATALSVGNAHICARLSDATVECWGSNGLGELGVGTTFTIGLTSAMTTDGIVKGPAAGFDRIIAGLGGATCGYFANGGGVHCWGDNTKGQLGYPDLSPRGNTPQNVPSMTTPLNFGTGVSATSMSLGSGHTCAILSNGQLHCWGQNSLGQLGLGYTSPAPNDFVGGSGTTTPDAAATNVPLFP